MPVLSFFKKKSSEKKTEEEKASIKCRTKYNFASFLEPIRMELMVHQRFENLCCGMRPFLPCDFSSQSRMGSRETLSLFPTFLRHT